MYQSGRELCLRMKRVIFESEKYIELLHFAPCIYSRKMLLFKLRCNMIELISLCIMQPQQREQRQRNFTFKELSNYTGKDGNPAFVAVNGVVYDVTNAAGWAAASHFGLTAGKDLTSEFASCHATQSILNKLKVVGKLI